MQEYVLPSLSSLLLSMFEFISSTIVDHICTLLLVIFAWDCYLLQSSLMGVSLTIPISNGRLALGTWQGIYLNEHRDYGGRLLLKVQQGSWRFRLLQHHQLLLQIAASGISFIRFHTFKCNSKTFRNVLTSTHPNTRNFGHDCACLQTAHSLCVRSKCKWLSDFYIEAGPNASGSQIFT